MFSGKEASAAAEVRGAFADYNRQVTVNNIMVGSYLGMVLMPAGMVLDYFVYPEKVLRFLQLRLLCSLLIGFFWAIVVSGVGRRHYRVLGVTLAMLPAFFISWMIRETEGAESPYYAGLNLVLLVIGFVVQWTVVESLVAVSLVIAMYLEACHLHGSLGQTAGTLINNLYFLTLTGIIVVTGSYVHTRLRFREFALRFELDTNRRILEDTNRKLVELDQAKSRFFANISHELRTPLTLLLGPLETLLAQPAIAAQAELRDTLANMRANGMRLLKLINDLLDLVRLESGHMEVRREAVPMPDFLRGLANSIAKVATEKGIKFGVTVNEQLGTVLVDRDKLEKILLNLLFNAIKFTPAGARVELAAGREPNQVILQVKDTGMGIAENHLPLIFDRFWQADSSSQRKYQGVGIGLSLVKELVEVQGGKVSVESRLGSGTTFTVRLPYVEAPAVLAVKPDADSPADAKPAEWLVNLYRRAELFPALSPLRDGLRPVEAVSPSKFPRVLIADDEPDMLRFLKSQLSNHFQVLEAVDGQQAFEKACQFLPDLIVLDMMMPEKDGLQVCRELRARTSTKSLPIILLTARADEETKLATLSAGANDFLSKPFSITELHVRVKNLVEAHQFQKRLARQNQILEATIGQLKETESQLVQTEKLASLGRLSAGIIHEINNPLNYATTGLYALRRQADHLSNGHVAEFEEILGDVEEGIQRVRRIVSDLRTFTHPNTDQVDEVDVAEIVTSTLRFLSHEWKDKVRLETRVPEHFTVQGNKNKLIQVLVNLVQNSLYTVRRKSFVDDAPTIWIEGRTEAGKQILTVRDNGEGIDQENLDKVFDPFFTTKDVGEGMGLGLSICYRIVREYHGQIHVKSQPGKFCEFALEFPSHSA